MRAEGIVRTMREDDDIIDHDGSPANIADAIFVDVVAHLSKGAASTPRRHSTERQDDETPRIPRQRKTPQTASNENEPKARTQERQEPKVAMARMEMEREG